ncbi:MAG: hypothetical protein HFF46_06345 [Lawsonibacter sp.]|nr:hypothetical protein [Lawsonibacter sp.]
MKKKTLSLALALAMCLSLTVPAFAEEDPDAPMSVEEGLKNVVLEVEIGDLEPEDIQVKKSLTLREYDDEDWETPIISEKNGYYAIKKDTVFTVSHNGTQDDGSYIRVYLTVFEDFGDGVYEWVDWPHSYYLTRNAGFIGDVMDPDSDGIGGLVELHAGQSVQFTIADDWYYENGVNALYEFRTVIYYPQYDYSYWRTYHYFQVDEAAYNAAVAKGPSAQPEQPTDPEPTTPPAETIPASGTAVASTQTVTVDGKAVEFQMYALVDENGNGTNYIKLRDMAQVLNGTEAQFSVGYDNASKSISVATGEAYTSTGSEMTTPFSGDRAYTGGSQSIQVDGEATEMTAITLLDDAGGGYNYFKLRDLGKALGFNVGWSKEAGVFIESDKPYAE